jgi:hypothetical protein
MRTFKNAVVLVSVLLLAACGGSNADESKVTKVDGTSNATAKRSLEKMVNTMPDAESIQWQTDVAMLGSRYPEGEEFSKRFGGKTLEELKPAIAEAKTYFINTNRERVVAAVQVDIDEQQAKLAGFESTPDSNTKNMMIAKTKGKIIERTQARDAVLALTDDQFFSEYGCACQETKLKNSAGY